ncbi:nicotinamide riboside transporter PnuC [Saccharicrinis sp. FJH62]|uniref:nicotinamide riboside transporter PnuC n=1 Tax=Saccharicrinis sp. FJH62 TaxID=3344657 RepID=UPI0035D4674B
MLDWIIKNYVEITGALLGILYLWFEIKQNKLLWPLGILTSAFYIFIFFSAKFYADMGLNVYYVVISIYGWYYWMKGGKRKESEEQSENEVVSEELPVSRITTRLALTLLGVTIPVFIVIAYVLVSWTDSPVPYWDAFTTALSITATWMLARKILEQWLVWILVNAVSLGLYIYKGLYPTVVLFFFYTVLAIVGYYRWRRDYDKQFEHAAD